MHRCIIRLGHASPLTSIARSGAVVHKRINSCHFSLRNYSNDASPKQDPENLELFFDKLFPRLTPPEVKDQAQNKEHAIKSESQPQPQIQSPSESPSESQPQFESKHASDLLDFQLDENSTLRDITTSGLQDEGESGPDMDAATRDELMLGTIMMRAPAWSRDALSHSQEEGFKPSQPAYKIDKWDFLKKEEDHSTKIWLEDLPLGLTTEDCRSMLAHSITEPFEIRAVEFVEERHKGVTRRNAFVTLRLDHEDQKTQIMQRLCQFGLHHEGVRLVVQPAAFKRTVILSGLPNYLSHDELMASLRRWGVAHEAVQYPAAPPVAQRVGPVLHLGHALITFQDHQAALAALDHLRYREIYRHKLFTRWGPINHQAFPKPTPFDQLQRSQPRTDTIKYLLESNKQLRKQIESLQAQLAHSSSSSPSPPCPSPSEPSTFPQLTLDASAPLPTAESVRQRHKSELKALALAAVSRHGQVKKRAAEGVGVSESTLNAWLKS